MNSGSGLGPKPMNIATLVRVLLLLAVSGLFSGCATDDDPTRVSTIPFNRPERWEGQGPMGGMMPQSR
jgi:hypothetical protein